MKEIATQEGIDNSYISRIANLTKLAPDIVATILNDALPNRVTLFDVVVYSSDGINWTVASGIPASFHPQGSMSLAYGGDQWVVTDGSSGSDYTITNGMTWVAVAPTFKVIDYPSTPTGVINPCPLIFGNGIWLTASFFTSANAPTSGASPNVPMM